MKPLFDPAGKSKRQHSSPEWNDEGRKPVTDIHILDTVVDLVGTPVFSTQKGADPSDSNYWQLPVDREGKPVKGAGYAPSYTYKKAQKRRVKERLGREFRAAFGTNEKVDNPLNRSMSNVLVRQNVDVPWHFM